MNKHTGRSPDSLQPAFSPRRLRVWNTKTQAAICDLNFVTAILSIQMNRQRLVVVLEKKIYIFDLNTVQILETLDTAPNPRGMGCLSPSANGFFAFPSGAAPGELLLYDTTNLSVLNALQAHKASIMALTFNAEGTLLATASETGTLLRVFAVPTGEKKWTFRRGTYAAEVYSLAFNATSTILCASSATGTIHVFSLTGDTSSATGSFGQVTGLVGAVPPASAQAASAYLPPALTDLVDGARDFAYARLRSSGVPNLCAIHGPKPGETQAALLVATIDGYFYQYALDTSIGGECRLERENVLRDTTSEEIGATYLSTTEPVANSTT